MNIWLIIIFILIGIAIVYHKELGILTYDYSKLKFWGKDGKDDGHHEKPKSHDSHASHSSGGMGTFGKVVWAVAGVLVLILIIYRSNGNTDSFTVTLDNEYKWEMHKFQYAVIKPESEVILKTADGRVGYVDTKGNLHYSHTDKSTNECGEGYWKMWNVPGNPPTEVSVTITDTRPRWKCVLGIYS